MAVRTRTRRSVRKTKKEVDYSLGLDDPILSSCKSEDDFVLNETDGVADK